MLVSRFLDVGKGWKLIGGRRCESLLLDFELFADWGGGFEFKRNFDSPLGWIVRTGCFWAVVELFLHPDCLWLPGLRVCAVIGTADSSSLSVEYP